MKKLLLIAAMAALALGASADGYKIEKVWELSPTDLGLVVGDARQGFGMNGKFYINDKNMADGAVPVVYEIDENGFTGVTFPGGANCGISRDDAGNIIVCNAVFPSASWGETASIKVINPTTGEVVEYTIPVEECGIQGRSDFIGCGKGNLMEDGVLYFTGATNQGICVMTIAGGEVDEDNCYLALCDGLNRDNMTIVNPYTDINGEEVLLWVYRSGNGTMNKLTADGDNFERTLFSLPNKGACNGTCPFIWDGKELFLYPTLPNYLNGFAVGEADAEAPIVEVPAFIAAATNTFQANWLNAEVDDDGVTIYQYTPGSNITVWRLTKDEPAPEPANVYILGQVNENDWAPNVGLMMDYDAENDLYISDNVHIDGRGLNQENYFSFTTELAIYDDQGSWDYILPFRFGAYTENYQDFPYDDSLDGQPIPLTYEGGQAIRIMGGDYELVLDKNAMTLTIHRWQLGDVNHDRSIDVGDVTMLISAILNGVENMEGFYLAQANCDLDEEAVIDVGDVTALIALILSN